MQYNAVGSMTLQRDHQLGKVKEMQYDSDNRITEVTNPDAATSYEQTVGRYYYDDYGFRTRKIGRRVVDVNGTDVYREYVSDTK